MAALLAARRVASTVRSQTCRALSQHTSLSDFDFQLPEELIAQVPAEPRDAARLMVVHRGSGRIEHRVFRELPSILSPQHMIVANNSRVVNCKLTATVCSTASPVVVYLLRQLNEEGTVWEVSGDDAYEALRPNERFFVDSPKGQRIEGSVMDAEDSSSPSRVCFSRIDGDAVAVLREAAQVPLPPYIRETRGGDSGGYQTVYAKEDGSVAAPTAGLHFTEAVLEGLAARGIQRQELTLHVGYGTFGHVHHEELSRHRMHSEAFTLSDGVANAINQHKSSGGKLLAVGTTSTRVLESCVGPDGRVAPHSGETDIFIHPGYRFKAVDALLTNFHMPKLTPIMLVAAFAGYDVTMKAYEEAVKRKYRFFSFGDSMLIL